MRRLLWFGVVADIGVIVAIALTIKGHELSRPHKTVALPTILGHFRKARMGHFSRAPKLGSANREVAKQTHRVGAQWVSCTSLRNWRNTKT